MKTTLTSSVVVSALVQYMRAKRGHGTVWRPVNNPISRRTDETKSVTSKLVTQRPCSSPKSALSMLQHWWKQRCFWSHISLWQSFMLYAHTVASASWQLLVTDSLSNLSNQNVFTSLHFHLSLLSQDWLYTYRGIAWVTCRSNISQIFKL